MYGRIECFKRGSMFEWVQYLVRFGRSIPGNVQIQGSHLGLNTVRFGKCVRGIPGTEDFECRFLGGTSRSLLL